MYLAILQKNISNSIDSFNHTQLTWHIKQAMDYEDKFITIQQQQITIRNYYFPIYRSKTITFDEIEAVATGDELGLTFWHFKHWGMGLARIWWALDWDRLFNGDHNIVIKKRGTSLKLGFSAERPNEVLRLLERFRRHRRASIDANLIA